jgi:hypothetical protein
MEASVLNALIQVSWMTSMEIALAILDIISTQAVRLIAHPVSTLAKSVSTTIITAHSAFMGII